MFHVIMSMMVNRLCQHCSATAVPLTSLCDILLFITEEQRNPVQLTPPFMVSEGLFGSQQDDARHSHRLSSNLKVSDFLPSRNVTAEWNLMSWERVNIWRYMEIPSYSHKAMFRNAFKSTFLAYNVDCWRREKTTVSICAQPWQNHTLAKTQNLKTRVW